MWWPYFANCTARGTFSPVKSCIFAPFRLSAPMPERPSVGRPACLVTWVHYSRMPGQLSRRIAPFRPVLCHNDLLPANLIDDSCRLWLVDWEYAGAGHPLFDLANASANAGFSAEQDSALLEGCRRTLDRTDLAELHIFKAIRCCAIVVGDNPVGHFRHRFRLPPLCCRESSGLSRGSESVGLRARSKGARSSGGESGPGEIGIPCLTESGGTCPTGSVMMNSRRSRLRCP